MRESGSAAVNCRESHVDLESDMIIDDLDQVGLITRSTLIQVAPLDAQGKVRVEYTLDVTAGELVLLKTRDLVYNYIGTSWCDGICSEHKETYINYAKRNNIDGVVPADWFLSHSWGMSFYDTVDTLLPNADDCYIAMITPTYKIVWIFNILMISFCPFIGWLLLIIYGQRKHILSQIAKPRWYTSNAILTLANESYWIDILCKNH